MGLPPGVARSLGVTSALPAGLPARRLAADILESVLHRRRPLDEQLQDRAAQDDFSTLPDRDRALVRALAATVLRRLGTLRHVLGAFLERGTFDRNTAQRFLESILSRGGSRDPLEAFVEFRGRKPQVDALLRQYGIAA